MAKTTLEIQDNLFIRAKQRAAQMRIPLRSVVEVALRNYLKAALFQKQQSRKQPKIIHWVTVSGKLSPDLELQNRESMVAWLKNKKLT
ncbi:MAG: hypothetical protein HYS98_00990 [Deltaproteobacteria bacterium]|nr:hypothetical protein [Deltaproteobacteria bacterium]